MLAYIVCIASDLRDAVKYLNQSLPSKHNIRYIAWDMARCAHSKDGNVLMRLDEIAESTMKVFHVSYQDMQHALSFSSLDTDIEMLVCVIYRAEHWFVSCWAASTIPGNTC
jgi:hypothetical protein